MEKLKWYLINIGLTKYLPVAAMAGLATLGTFMAAHAGMLEQWGVTYGAWPLAWTNGNVPTGNVILIELDTTSQALIALVVSLVTLAIRATEHHTVGVVTGPQPEVGGSRPGDPPKEVVNP